MLTLVTGPAARPLTAAEARTQTRHSTLDATLAELLIDAAVQRGERATNRAWITQTWDEVLDAFPPCGFIEVPKPPLQSVTHIKYRDTTGTLQTWASSNYVVEAPAGPRCARGRISLAYGVTWPSTYGQAGDVQIRFVCGYGATAATVPAILRMAALMDVATLYANPENVIKGIIVAALPGGSKDIYDAHHSYPTQRRAA
jgi:uncharacterized phiE125 gp8 family phage protein